MDGDGACISHGWRAKKRRNEGNQAGPRKFQNFKNQPTRPARPIGGETPLLPHALAEVAAVWGFWTPPRGKKFTPHREDEKSLAIEAKRAA